MKVSLHFIKATLVLLCLFFLLILNSKNGFSQCTNSSSYGSATAPASGCTQITTIQYATEYATISSVVAGTAYKSTSSITTDFLTVRQGSYNGPCVAAGVTPLSWTAPVAGTYYVHCNTNSACGTATTNRTTQICYGASGCTNTSSYGSANAPTAGCTQITTAQYATEYATISSVAAGTTYTSTSSITTDFLTVHQGSYNGPIIASGITPLTWTATVSGTYYVHCNTNSSCGTATTSRTTQICYVGAPFGCSGPTSITTSVSPTGSCNSSQSVTFNVASFTGGALGGGSWEYQWQNGATVLQSWSTTSSYTATLNNSATYTVYMRSSACTASVSSGYNATYSLYTASSTTPVLSSPADNSVQTTSAATLSWAGSIGSHPNSRYEYSLNSGIWTSTGAGTSVGVTLNVGANTWQVRYYDGCSAQYYTTAVWTVYYAPNNYCGSVNHGGNSWTISANTTVGGNHTNVGTFTINSSITATIDAACHYFYVEAESIVVSGIINADGVGYSGGAGGNYGGFWAEGGYTDGRGITSCWDKDNCRDLGLGGGLLGSAGSGPGGGGIGGNGTFGYGSKQECGFWSDDGGVVGGGGGAGGGAGGTYGGAGGNGQAGGIGGKDDNQCGNAGCQVYIEGSGGTGGNAAATYGNSTTEAIEYGSGGAGAGGGGRGSFCGANTCYSAGGNGGTGGGAVKLVATQNLTINASGSIYANGSNGGNGGEGGENDYTSDCCADLNDDCTEQTFTGPGGGGTGAGAGSGGGIMLKADCSIIMNGTLQAKGGNGGAGGDGGWSDWSTAYYGGKGSGGAGGGGGRIKIFQSPCGNNTIAGFISYNGGSGGAVASFGRASTGSAGNTGSSGSYSVNTSSTSISLSGGTSGSSQSVCTGGDPAELTNIASATTGVCSFSYQWMSCTSGCTVPPTGYAIISGATGATYDPPSGLTQTTYYCRRVTAGSCTSYSNYIIVTVVPDPSITTQPSGGTICAGGSFTLSVIAAGGTPVLTYQWYNTGGAISGATSSSYVATAAGDYYCIVAASASGCGSATTNTVTVSVVTDPAITTQPSSGALCAGSSITLNIVASGGTPSLTYQWYNSGGVIAGATSSSYSAAAAESYYCIASASGNGCGSVTSSTAVVTVSNPATTGLVVGDYVWSGNTSTDWAVATNWLVYNGAGVYSVAVVKPDSSKNVIFRNYGSCATNTGHILGGYTADCRSITIESSLTMGAGSVLNVARNWTNTLGTFNPGTGSVKFNGLLNIVSTIYTGGNGAGKQFYNLVINSTSNTGAGTNDGNKVNLEGNIRINNDFILTSGYQFNVNSASTMSIGGNFTHNICEFNRGLGSVTLTGTAKLIDGAAVTYFRILNISGSYTLTEPSIYLWSNPLGDYGDLNILPGGSLNATNKDIFIDGSWTNNGTFIAGTGSVLFTRGYDQTIFSGGSRFYNMFVVKDAALPYLTILDPAWITSHCGFGMGIVNFSGTGSLTFTDNSSSDDGSSLSFVDGPVIKEGNDGFVFPVGDETSHPLWPHVWAPLFLSNAAGAASDKFTCEYFFTAAPNNYNAWNMCDYTALHHASGIEYWMLNRNSGTATPDVGLFWKNADRSGITNVSEVVVAHYEPCPMPAGPLKWKAMSTSASGTTGPTGTGLAIGTGFTNYSPITFGTKTNSNPLPVSLLDFTAVCTANGVEVQWTTATETNNDYFIVERSQDAISWQTVTTVQGAGNSNSSLNYQVLDAQPYGGTSFYRLRQVDYNGQSETFNAVAVRCNEGQPSVSFYPNPFTSGLSIDMVNIGSDKATLTVYDILGQKVLAKNLVSNELSNGTLILDLEPLAKGLYTIEFRSDSYSKIAKIVKN